MSENSIKVSESRPRFKISKRAGRNLKIHPRIKLKIKNIVNPKLGRVNSGFEPQRINDIGPLYVSLRTCLKDFYSIRSSRLTGSTISKAASHWKIKNIENRLDVLLHRRGLTNSILQARQVISHGHVYTIFSHEYNNLLPSFDQSFNEFKLKNPSYIVKKGMIIYIENNFWQQRIKSNIIQWNNWLKIKSNRRIPPYIEVDYINGSFVLVNNPKLNTILIPAGLGKSTQSQRI